MCNKLFFLSVLFYLTLHLVPASAEQGTQPLKTEAIGNQAVLSLGQEADLGERIMQALLLERQRAISRDGFYNSQGRFAFPLRCRSAAAQECIARFH